MCLWFAVSVYRRSSLITDFDNVFGFWRICIVPSILQTVFSLTIYRIFYIRFCLGRTQTINGYAVGSICRFDAVSSIFVTNIVEWQAFNGHSLFTRTMSLFFVHLSFHSICHGCVYSIYVL